MVVRTIHSIGVLFVVLLTAACIAQLPVQPLVPGLETDPGTVQGAPVASDCPAGQPGQELIRIDAAGYCFLVPAGYEAEYYEENGGTIVRAPASSEGHRERLFIDIQEALGRTLEETVGQILAGFSLPDWEFEVTELTVGGEPATMLRPLPGQNINRRVVVVQGGRILEMTFMPDDPEMGAAYAEMEELYAAVMGSLAFIPPTNPMGLPLSDAGESGYPVDAALAWERQILGDGGAVAECQRLVITAEAQTWVGSCDKAELTAAPAPFHWAEIQSRFAPFTYYGGESKITFAGEGDIYHPAWERAIDAWAQISYGETLSQRTGASVRTVMSWWLGALEDEAELCQHLVVLGHGYAYANLSPCGGGEARILAEGWLETEEMEALDNWIYTTAPFYLDASYLDGRGEQVLSQSDSEQLGQWAAGVFARLAE